MPKKWLGVNALYFDRLHFLTDLGYTMGYFNLGIWYPHLTEIASGGGEMYWFRKEPLSCGP
jgi:hypothetical protein